MTKRLVAVVVGFACCWLPIFIIDNIDMANLEKSWLRSSSSECKHSGPRAREGTSRVQGRKGM